MAVMKDAHVTLTLTKINQFIFLPYHYYYAHLRASGCFFSLCKFSQRSNLNRDLKPTAHWRKQLSKLLGKAVCSAVSSHVRWRFPENFATQGREENICHV